MPQGDARTLEGPPPGGRSLMYLSALGGVVATVALWNLMTAGEAPVPEVRLRIHVGEFDDTGNGLQEELLSLLARFPGLEVQAMGPGPAADFELDGSVRATENGWTLEVRLLDHDEQRVVWSEKILFEGGTPEDAGQRITDAIARTLKMRRPNP